MATDAFAPLRAAKNVSLTTWRRDGTPVPTPVWVVVDDGQAWVVSRGPGKVKRIRNNPDVMLAPCTMRGRVTGPAVAGRAEVAGTEIPRAVRRLILRKYKAAALFAFVATRLSPRKPTVLHISPAAGG